jgi:hypothetical protein
VSDALQIAGVINRQPNAVKSGTLRIWGDWFGRPHDNQHRVVAAEVNGTQLRVLFDQDEVLLVQEPAGSAIDGSSFRITAAQRVRWEWFYYGRAHTAANRYFLEYARDGKQLHCTSNVDWYVPAFETNLSLPAVELL